MTKLLEAAEAVLDCWNAPRIDDDGREVIETWPMQKLMDALRQAMQEAETYKPMTDDELDAITNKQWGKQSPDIMYAAYRASHRAVERAVIERLGMRWPE